MQTLFDGICCRVFVREDSYPGPEIKTVDRPHHFTPDIHGLRLQSPDFNGGGAFIKFLTIMSAVGKIVPLGFAVVCGVVGGANLMNGGWHEALLTERPN